MPVGFTHFACPQPVTSPRLSRYNIKAHMYKAVDVAEQALKLRTMRAPPEEAPRAAAQPREASLPTAAQPPATPAKT